MKRYLVTRVDHVVIAYEETYKLSINITIVY